MTPAEKAAAAIVDDVAVDYAVTRKAAARHLAVWTSIIAEATQDAWMAEIDAREDGRRAGIAEGWERGMRRTARLAALLYWETVRTQCLTGRRWKHYDRAAMRCWRIAHGEPAFTTPRAILERLEAGR